MASTGQEEVFAFLGAPATHGLSEPVKRIDTHAATVFLAGPDVYKVKRAVRFPFLDQTTLARRRTACDAEVAVNRHFTPELYLGVVPITRDGTSLRLGGDGQVIEWTVHLKRFDETQTLDLIAEGGGVTDAMIARIADLIRDSHRRARIGDGVQATTALGEVVDETLTEIIEAPEVFPPEPAMHLAATMRLAYQTVRPLLLARGAHGSVRRCHGDLHLRNIALLDRGPVLFDAIEFDESIATTDVLYDLAFAVMDLWQRRLPNAANLLLNRYLWLGDDPAADLAGLAALPLFLSLRAAVLAKIDAIRFRDVDRSIAAKAEARRYFDAAVELLDPEAPVLIAIGGLSGSGKSTLAARIASAIGRPPGAIHLRSDIERKRLFGVPELQPLTEAAYRREVTDHVFARLRDHAGVALGAGQGVIVDAVHLDHEERRLIADVAARASVRFVGLWLDAPVAVLVGRVERRTNDASDATGAVVKEQARADLGPLAWIRLDAASSLAAMVDAALAACGARRMQ